MRGDEMCQTIAREAPQYLNEAGFCQFMADWAIVKDEDWQERLRGWFAGTGCDAWVLRRGWQPIDQYATGWIETEGEDTEEFASFFQNWMDYYEKLGIESIGSGLVTMRLRSGVENWFAIEDAPETMTYPCGDEVEQVFRTQDFLQQLGPEGIIDSRFRVSPSVRFDQEFQLEENGWQLISSLVRHQNGLNHAGTIDVHGAELLQRCTGEPIVRELLSELAAGANTDLESVLPTGLNIFQRLIEQRFLLPVTD